MKTSLLLVVATFWVTLASSLAEATCAPPDFKKIFLEIEAAPSISESIQVRQKHLPEMCGIKDFDRLTELESLAPGEHYFNEYKWAVAEFIVENVAGFTSNYWSARTTLFQRLFKKLLTDEQAFKARINVLDNVRRCSEFYDLFQPWEDPHNWNFRRTLNNFIVNHSAQFCRWSG